MGRGMPDLHKDRQIKQVFRGQATAKSRTRVSEISSSSSEVPTIQDYVAYVTDCKEQAELQRQNEQEVM